MRRIVLIARREIVAYASVPSFWIALLMGPLLIAMTALALGSMGSHLAPPPAVQTASVTAPDAEIRQAAEGALRDAAALDHRALKIIAPGAAADQMVVLTRRDGGLAGAVRGAPLTPVATALLGRDLKGVQRGHGRSHDVTFETVAAPAPATHTPPAAVDDTRFARFSLTALLWLVLVGSLGMLLQAVVRERSNRALESLLSAVRPSDLLFGKLAGVGVLSVIVVAAWLAGGAAIAATPLARSAPAAGLLFRGFQDLPMLANAGVLYVLAFAMYGSGLIALGALARDVPTAQNMSRPVFGLLLLIFFVALAQFAGMGDGALPLLALIAPFTPFAVLLAKPGAIDAAHLAGGVLGMLLTTALCTWVGIQALRGEFRWRRRRRTAVAPA